MTLKWVAIVGTVLMTGLAVAASDPALARSKKKVQRQCVDRPQFFTYEGLDLHEAPAPNGCSPAVHNYGRYVGQDPDPFIRQQLMRDPQSGYTQY